MRAVAAIALAPAASAETVARRTPAVGPALTGEAVAWGEETRGGGARVVRRTPGSPPQVVYESPAPTADRTRRGFMHIPAAFGASGDAFAALVHTSTVVSEGLHGPVGRVDVPVAVTGDVRHVRLAGRFVAWIQRDRFAGDELVVHDLERAVAVALVRARDVAATSIGDAALQPDGAVAFTLAGRRCSRLAVRSIGSPRLRVFDRRAASRGLAIAAGRVLYERSSGRRGSAVVLRKLGGSRPRTLARISARRIHAGSLDLDATRATWATVRRHASGTYEPAPGARGRIVLRAL